MSDYFVTCSQCGYSGMLPPHQTKSWYKEPKNCPQCAQLKLLNQIANNSNNSSQNNYQSTGSYSGPGFFKGLLSLIALIVIVFFSIFVWDISVKVWTWVMEYKWYIIGVITIIVVSLSTKSGQEGLKRGYEKSRNGESFTDKN